MMSGIGDRGLAHSTEVMEHALLGLSRTEQVLNRLTSASGRRRQFETIGGVQYVRHLVRVVLVHLAAKGADVQLAAHVGSCGSTGKSLRGKNYSS